MKTFLLFILAFSTLAFGATRIPDYNSNNKYRFGTSGTDKEFEYETGGSNPKFSISNLNKDFSFNKTVRQKGSYSFLGPGTNTDIYSLFDIDGVSGPSTKPGYRWNSLTSKLQFSNDGSTWNDIGTGSGGGGSSSSVDANSVYAFPNIASNPGFENGTNGWTASGGTFTVTPSYPNVGFGSYSGSWDPSSANQTLTMDQQTIPGGLLSRNCMAEIYYKGGDSGYQLQAIDGSSNVLATASMPTSVSYAVTAVPFACPSSGTFALRVKSTLSNGALIYLDKAFLGEAIRAPKDILSIEMSGGSCAINLGVTDDSGVWHNTGSVTCPVTEKVVKNLTGFTQAADQYGVTGYFNAHTYRICTAIHYETQLLGNAARIAEGFRFAVCAGSSACSTSGQAYYTMPYMDYRNGNGGGTALYSSNFQNCMYHTFSTPGIYSVHLQETTLIATSITSATNDIGCNTSDATCYWQIEQAD